MERRNDTCENYQLMPGQVSRYEIDGVSSAELYVLNNMQKVRLAIKYAPLTSIDKLLTYFE